ncbi:hypothetical protein FG386_000211 [Cryptosporidium ryanae]|uniref:uncharacterized protein n=1 Tax=Cryptosporidium ryanae TaxID=515981 RepID=UPI00351A6EA2|nr:hypothetical protein FG386_000211 [Cryptosporidium ryanae]
MLSNFENGLTEEDLDLLLCNEDEQYEHNDEHYCGSDNKERNISENSISFFNFEGKRKVKSATNRRANSKSNKSSRKRRKNHINVDLENGIDSDEFVVPDDEAIPPDWEYNYEKPIVCQDVTFYNRVDSMINSVWRTGSGEKCEKDLNIEFFNIEKDYIDDKDNTELILKDGLLKIENEADHTVFEKKNSRKKASNSGFETKNENSSSVDFKVNRNRGIDNTGTYELCVNLNLFYKEVETVSSNKSDSPGSCSEGIKNKASRLSLLFKAIDVEFSGLSLSQDRDQVRIESLKTNLNLFFLVLNDLILDHRKTFSGNNKIQKALFKQEIFSYLKETHLDMTGFINTSQENILSSERVMSDEFVKTVNLFIRIIGLTLSVESFLVHCIKSFSGFKENQDEVPFKCNPEDTCVFTVFDSTSSMFLKGAVSKLLKQILDKILHYVVGEYAKDYRNSNIYSSLILTLYINAKLKGTDVFMQLNDILLSNKISTLDSLSLYSCLLFSYFGIKESKFSPCIVFPKRLFIDIMNRDNRIDHEEFFKLLCCLNDYLVNVNLYIINEKLDFTESDVILHLIEFVLEFLTFNSMYGSDIIAGMISTNAYKNSFFNVVTDSIRLALYFKNYSYENLSGIFLLGQNIIDNFIFIVNDSFNIGLAKSKASELLNVMSKAPKRKNLNYLKISFTLFLNIFNVILNSSNCSTSLWDSVLRTILNIEFGNMCRLEREDILFHFFVYSCVFSAICSCFKNSEYDALLLYLFDKYNSETELIMNYLLTEILLDEQDQSSSVCVCDLNGGFNNKDQVKEIEGFKKGFLQSNIELVKNLRVVISLLVSGKLSLYPKLESLEDAIGLFNRISDFDEQLDSGPFLSACVNSANSRYGKTETRNEARREYLAFLEMISILMNSTDIADNFGVCLSEKDEKALLKLLAFTEKIENLMFKSNCKTLFLLFSSRDSRHEIVSKLFEFLNNLLYLVIRTSFSLNLLDLLEGKLGETFKLVSGKLVEIKTHKGKNREFGESSLKSFSSKFLIECLCLVYNSWEKFQEGYNLNCSHYCTHMREKIKQEVYYVFLIINLLVFDDFYYLNNYHSSHFKLNEKLLFNCLNSTDSVNFNLTGNDSKKRFFSKKYTLKKNKSCIFLLLERITNYVREFYSLTSHLDSEKRFDCYKDLVRGVMSDYILDRWVIDKREDKKLDFVGLNVSKIKSDTYIKLFFYYYIYSNDKQFSFYLNKKLIEFSINLYQCEVLHGFLLNMCLKGNETSTENGLLNWIHVGNSIKGMINQLGDDHKVSAWIVNNLFDFFMVPSILETKFITLRSQIWSNILSIPLSTLLTMDASCAKTGYEDTLNNIIKYTYLYCHKVYLLVLNFSKLNDKNSTFGLSNNFILANISINFIFDLNRLIHLSYFDIAINSIKTNHSRCSRVNDGNLNRSSGMFSNLLLKLLFISNIFQKLLVENAFESERHESVFREIFNRLNCLDYYITEKSILLLYHLRVIDGVDKASLTDKVSLLYKKKNCNLDVQRPWVNEFTSKKAVSTDEYSENNNILEYVTHNNGIDNGTSIFSRIPVVYGQFISFNKNKKRIINSLLKDKSYKFLFCSNNSPRHSLYNSNLTHAQNPDDNPDLYRLLAYIESSVTES